MATPESTSITSNANLTAEEIGKRFLKLIEQLDSRNDLSVDGTQGVLGVTLNLDRPEFCRHSVAALRVAPFKLYR